MAGPSLQSQVHTQIGRVAAMQEAQDGRLDAIERTLLEDRRAASDDRRLILEKLDTLSASVIRMEPTITEVKKLAAENKGILERIGDLELFRGRVGAVVALASSAAGLLVAGVSYLISQFWADLIAVLRRLWP